MASDGRQYVFWIAVLLAVLLGLSIFKDILLPFVAGMFLAYFINPLVDRLQVLGLSRTAAAGLLVGIGAAALIVGLVLVAPVLAAQMKQLVLSLPNDVERARAAIETVARQRLGGHFEAVQAALDRVVAELQSGWAGVLSSMATGLLSRGAALINVLSLVLITPLVVFYLLVDWHPMLARVQLWLPRDHADTIGQLADEINDAVSAFIRGQGAVCLCLALFYAIGLTAVGLNYGALVGLMTGVLAFVPMVGWFVGLVIAAAIAIVQFAPQFTPVLWVLAVMVGGMALDTALLSPRLVGKKVGLHPVWLIFALFAFSYLFGAVGTLVAVPVSAAIAVLVRFGIARYLESDVYRGRSVASPTAGLPLAQAPLSAAIAREEVRR